MFNIGDTVHYPGHGICTIKTIFDKKNATGDGPTYVLKPVNAAFKFQRLVLTDKKARKIGVHYLINKEDMPKLFETLRERPESYSYSKIRGYIEVKEKLDSGDLLKIAEVMRDMEALSDIVSLFLRVRLLRTAKRILIDEVSGVNNISPKEAEDSIYRTLLIAKKERENALN